MSVNTQIEFLTIRYVLEKKDPSLLVAIGAEHFGNSELAKVYLLLRKYYLDNSEFISFDVLKGLVSKACKTEDKLRFMMSILDQIASKDVSGLTNEVLLQELNDYRKFRVVLKKAEGLVSAVEAKDIDQVLVNLQSMYNSVYVEGCSDLKTCDMAEQACDDIKFKFRKTGLLEWDKRGGAVEGGLFIIAAESKAGKSTLCGQMMLHQYLHEEGSVAYISYEMSAPECRSRILSNYCNVDLGRVMSDTMTDEEQRQFRLKESSFYVGEVDTLTQYVDENMELDRKTYFSKLLEDYPRRQNSFYVIDERLDWSSLFAKMQLLVETKNVVSICIDYVNLVPMSQDTKHLAQWEAILHMTRKLKNFSHKYGLNIFTPAQYSVGKGKEDSKIRFASNIIADCDVCLAMSTTDEDKTMGSVTCEFKAIRNGLSVPGEAFNKPFKLMKEFNFSRFVEINF